MPEFDPQVLAEWSGGVWRNGAPGRVAGFCHDSRRVRPGELFVALSAEFRDGHAFLEDARARGASGALVDRPVPDSSLPQLVADDSPGALWRIAARHRERFAGPLIGITGSCGKTSTKELLAELMAFRGPVFRTPGNFNNHLGVPLALLGIDPGYHAVAVIEAGINLPGEMEPLARLIRPDHALVTNVAPVHLEGLKDLDTIAGNKARLPAAVAADGFVVFPEYCQAFEPFRQLRSRVIPMRDDAAEPSAGRRFLDRFLPPAPAERSPECTVYRRETTDETRLELRRPGQTEGAAFSIRTVSAGMAENVALALLMAQCLGASTADLQKGLAAWRPAAFRGQVVSGEGGLRYLDCYNSNPVALVDALEAFDRLAPPGSPRLYVLGDMAELGPESDRFHRETMRFLALGSEDFAFLIGAGAPVMGEGLRMAGRAPEQWAVARDVEAVRKRVRAFRGSLFVKGSRRCRLERLVEESAVEPAVGKEAPC